MSEHLLPPGTSSPIEMGFSYIWDTYTRWHQLIQQIKHIGVTYTPDAWVPIFVWDLGLEDILPYVTNLQMALAEGPLCVSRTIQAFIEHCHETGDHITATIDPPDQRLHWSQFQLELPETVHDLDHIKRIDGIARLSKEAEDSLCRLFNPERDHRPIRMNRHKFAGGRFNGYSGERLWNDGPLISFAITLKGNLQKQAIKPIAGVMPTVLSGRITGRVKPHLGIAHAHPTQKVRTRRGWPVRWPKTGWDAPVMVRSLAASM